MKPTNHPAYDFDPKNKYKLLLQVKGKKPPYCMVGLCFSWEDDLVRFLEDGWLTGDAKREAERIKFERAAR